MSGTVISEPAGNRQSWVGKAFGRPRSWPRDLIAFGVTLLGYAFAMSSALYESAIELRAGALGHLPFPSHVVEIVGRALGTAGRARFAKELREAVARGEVSHGAALLRLNQLAAVERGTQEFDLARAVRLYQSILRDTRRRIEAGESVVPAIRLAAQAHGYKSYKRIHAWLGDALLNGGGSCEAQTALVSALALDLGLAGRAFIRVFDNHVAPGLIDERGIERHFGMLGGCRGLDQRIPAERMLELYDPTGNRPFAWPVAQGHCDDSLSDFSEPALEVRDRAAGSRGSGESERGREMMILGAHCGSPVVPWSKAHRVIILGPAAPAFSARHITVDPWQLGYQSERVKCQSRFVEDRREAGAPAVELAIELGKLVFMNEEASVVFTAAGHADLSREFQHRRSAAWRAAQKELLRANARRFEPEGGNRDPMVLDAWVLGLLGVEGRRVLVELAGSWTPALAALVWDVETRSQGLDLLERRPRLEQFLVLELLSDPELESRLSRASPGRSLKDFSLVRAAARGFSARECNFQKMLADVDARLEQYGLTKEFRVILLLLQADTWWQSHCSSQEIVKLSDALGRWIMEHDPAAARSLGIPLGG